MSLSKRAIAILSGATVLAAAVGCAPGEGGAVRKPENTQPAEAQPAEASQPRDSQPAAPAASTAPGFRKLVGKWLRPNDGYVLDIKGVSDEGKTEAAYFNPRPIRVSKAEAKREADTLRLFVELRDAGYPGCTYTLVYVPEHDVLHGVYYQAAMQQEFEVVFVRTQ